MAAGPLHVTEIVKNHENQSFHRISIATCSPAPMWDIEPLIKELYPQITIQTAVINQKDLITKLKEKAPTAKVIQADILKYDSGEKFDYIFICSGSVSLFTNMKMCKEILQKMKCLLKKDGKFVFAVETVADRCPDDLDYKTLISVKTEEGYELILKMKNYYDEKTHTQYSPSIYELYDETKLIQKEEMDFQTHLYELGELEPYLYEIGFAKVKVYSSYDKVIAENNQTEMFLYECSF